MLETLEDYRKAAEHAREMISFLMSGNRDFPRGLHLETAVAIGEAHIALERLVERLECDIARQAGQ
jgi:hypothetical protein